MHAVQSGTIIGWELEGGVERPCKSIVLRERCLVGRGEHAFGRFLSPQLMYMYQALYKVMDFLPWFDLYTCSCSVNFVRGQSI